ncbi:MAG: DUF3987 domain-containing protein [Caldilineaceae bacterium]|nr:DUF3987 domain-containing protein [Caldilineaceae bacterium]
MNEPAVSPAYRAVDRLLNGTMPDECPPEQYGRFAECIDEMCQALHAGGVTAVRRVFETYARHDPQIAALRATDYDEVDDRSPLPTEFTSDLRLGWIDAYAEVMGELTGSPREFNQLIGITIAATAVQRLARLCMNFGDIYPNVYAVLIGRSSVFHKSTALGMGRRTLRRAELDYLLLNELQTSEGLLRELEKQPAGLIIRDEIGTLFASNRTRYLHHLKPDLTALYDCYPYSRRRSNAEIKVEKPYLNILGATTPQRFADGVRHSDWVDGFLPRWLIVLPNGDPDFDATTSLRTAEQDDKIDELAGRLREVAQKPETDFLFAGDAQDLWHAWQRQGAMDAYYLGDDVTAAVMTRYGAYALKFAMILAAVNDEWGTISPSTMRTAIQLADNYKVYVHRILAERMNLGVSGSKLQRVHAVARKHDQGNGVTRKVLMQYTGYPRSDLAPCLEKLLEIGALIEHPTPRGQRYVAVGDSLPVKVWK